MKKEQNNLIGDIRWKPRPKREKSERFNLNGDLKPCPFCGDREIIHENTDGQHSIGCKNEDCFGYQSLTTFARYADAKKAWNTRVRFICAAELKPTIEFIDTFIPCVCAVVGRKNCPHCKEMARLRKLQLNTKPTGETSGPATGSPI